MSLFARAASVQFAYPARHALVPANCRSTTQILVCVQTWISPKNRTGAQPSERASIAGPGASVLLGVQEAAEKLPRISPRGARALRCGGAPSTWSAWLGSRHQFVRRAGVLLRAPRFTHRARTREGGFRHPRRQARRSRAVRSVRADSRQISGRSPSFGDRRRERARALVTCAAPRPSPRPRPSLGRDPRQPLKIQTHKRPNHQGSLRSAGGSSSQKL